ncbi:hypothetical protein CsSME_00024271 [Camellia sinensis var. sinensis]
MSNRQLHLTSPEQVSCTPFSSFEESSVSPLIDNSINDVDADVEVDVDDMTEIEENERDNEEVEMTKTHLKRSLEKGHRKLGKNLLK